MRITMSGGGDRFCNVLRPLTLKMEEMPEAKMPLSRRLLILLPFAAITLAACQPKEPGRRRIVGYGAWEPDGGE